MDTHEAHMKRCLVLAKEALSKGDPPVGAVIVHDGRIIAEGIESGKSTGDITNHAEILVIRDAIAKGHLDKLADSTLYSTHEPCIMCSYLIRHHHVPLIVYGTAVGHIGGHTSKYDVLNTKDVPNWGEGPEVLTNILLEDCDDLTARFMKQLQD
jgi:tRNA(adenine34) deaminase